MNHDPGFPLPDDAGEWAAQERALAEERTGLAREEGDPRLRSYRRVAQALAQPLDAQLPPGFARAVARQVQPAARVFDTRLERRLLALLTAAMVVAALAAVVVYGAGWLPTLDRGSVGEWLTRPWAWMLAMCLGLSRLSRHWLHHDHVV